MNKQNQTLMNTISNTYKRCKSENIGISLNHLRHICKYGVIPTCKAGRKYLINWNVLMDYLNGNFFELPNKSNNENKIRKLK